eukprot:354010-Chlamydomonas_euryale.AAC.3
MLGTLKRCAPRACEGIARLSMWGHFARPHFLKHCSPRHAQMLRTAALFETLLAAACANAAHGRTF